MADDLRSKLTGLWGKVKGSAQDGIARSEVAFAKGKAAGRAVYDDENRLIVDAGHIIDDDVLTRATAAGKLHAVASAAAAATAQDMKEKAEVRYNRTVDGKEARQLDSVEEYAQARVWMGWVTGLDVTDIRGEVLIPAGIKLNDEHFRVARSAGLLSALCHSASKGTSPADQRAAEAKQLAETPQGLVPEAHIVPQTGRTRLPLFVPQDDDG